MNTTKRKFNALLQGLSNPLPTTHTHTDANMIGDAALGDDAAARDSPLWQKRRRIGLPESTAPALLQSLRNNKPATSTAPPRQRDSYLERKAPVEAPLARYCPGDREEMLKRLRTFQEITDWTPKPDKMNEVEWAKRGWVCQGKERVRCVLCHKEVVVNFHRKDVHGNGVAVLISSEVEGALIDKYAELVVTSHQQDCLWRKRGCADNILRLSFASTAAILTAFRQRYTELCARESFLPYEFNIRLPQNLLLDDVLAKLPVDFGADNAIEGGDTGKTQSPINRVALILALLGWQGLSNPRIGQVPNSASCHTCQRRLGLWMFKSKEVDGNGQVLVQAPMEHLDPIREHRFFCPWKNSFTQSRTNQEPTLGTDLSGWEALLQTLNNETSLRCVYQGRPKTPVPRIHTEPPATSIRSHLDKTAPQSLPTIGVESEAVAPAINIELGENDDEEKDRSVKEKERWARLRRVKSLFDAKGSKKLRRQLN